MLIQKIIAYQDSDLLEHTHTHFLSQKKTKTKKPHHTLCSKHLTKQHLLTVLSVSLSLGHNCSSTPPNLTPRADSFYGQRVSSQYSNLRDYRVHKLRGCLEYERRKQEKWGKNDGISISPANPRQSTSTLQQGLPKNNSTTWHNIQHLHQHVPVSHHHRCVSSSRLVRWEVNRASGSSHKNMLL